MSELRSRYSWEWPTWLLLVGFYAAWLAILQFWHLAPWLLSLALVFVLAQFISLQHEFVHAHPTQYPWLNRLLGVVPFAVWYPYDCYFKNHLAHHRDPLLTLPGIDSESNYVALGSWQGLSVLSQSLRVSQRTSLGRLLLGPALTIIALWHEASQHYQEDRGAAITLWAVHIGLVIVLLGLVASLSAMPVWCYLLTAYLALGLAMQRSLYEHRPALEVEQRTVINEAAWPWRLLFLNNNYHSVHHAHPRMAWYLIPSEYWRGRQAYLRNNGDFFFDGLHAVFTASRAAPCRCCGASVSRA